MRRMRRARDLREERRRCRSLSDVQEHECKRYC